MKRIPKSLTITCLLLAIAGSPLLASTRIRGVFIGPHAAVSTRIVVRTVSAHRPSYYGTIDFDIKPNKSHLFVDGVYIGIADSFDGWPQTFRLRPGKHTLKIVSPAGKSIRRTVYIQPGKELNVRIAFRPNLSTQ